MDDPRIGLADYLRVFWWGRWIAVGGLLLGLGLGVLLFSSPPSTIQATMTYRVRNLPISALGGTPDAQEAVDDVVAAALAMLGQETPDVMFHQMNSTITLSWFGAPSEDEGLESLREAEEALRRNLQLFLNERLGVFAADLRSRAQDLSTEIGVSGARLDEAQAAGDANTVDGLTDRIAAAGAELVEIETILRTLESADTRDWLSLHDYTGPEFTAFAPQPALWIGLSSLLGLMVGVLATFSLQHALQMHRRKRRSGEARRG